MAKCPKCETEITASNRTWKLQGKLDTLGNRVRLIIGAFDCPRCFIQFREVINKAKISDVGSNSTAQPAATREIARERDIARVTCPYCDTPFDENLENMPPMRREELVLV